MSWRQLLEKMPRLEMGDVRPLKGWDEMADQIARAQHYLTKKIEAEQAAVEGLRKASHDREEAERIYAEVQNAWVEASKHVMGITVEAPDHAQQALASAEKEIDWCKAEVAEVKLA